MTCEDMKSKMREIAFRAIDRSLFLSETCEAHLPDDDLEARFTAIRKDADKRNHIDCDRINQLYDDIINERYVT